MLPFPRMLEFGRILNNEFELDIDFSKSSIGEANVIDYSDSNHIFTKLNSGQAEVVYDSTLNSNVMYFNGGVFSTPMVQSLFIGQRDFKFDVMYKSTATSIQVLYGTGYYPDLANRIAGMSHQIGQYIGDDQYFVDSGTDFYRNRLSQSTISAWQRLVYTRANGLVQIDRYDINDTFINTIQLPDHNFGNGNAFSVGGYYQTPSSTQFYGYMKYLKLKLL